MKYTGWKVKGWKKIFHASINQTRATVAIPISDKIEFKTKTVTKNKGHYILMKGLIHYENQQV